MLFVQSACLATGSRIVAVAMRKESFTVGSNCLLYVDKRSIKYIDSVEVTQILELQGKASIPLK